jgi:hypothetical protein
MAPERGGTPASQPPAREPGSGGGDAGGAELAGPDLERFGPLALRRMIKDDGRALLVYEVAGARSERP